MQRNGLTVWLTGLSSSGKSTLALALEMRFRQLGWRVEVLDGDAVREKLSRELGFTKRDRDLHVRRMGYVAMVLSRNGIVTIAAAISPYRSARQFNRRQIHRYIEVYCKCPLEVAEARDVKGLYRRARNGEIQAFTGIDDPYEEPMDPEVVVNTDTESVVESVDKIWSVLEERCGIPAWSEVVKCD